MGADFGAYQRATSRRMTSGHIRNLHLSSYHLSRTMPLRATYHLFNRLGRESYYRQSWHALHLGDLLPCRHCTGRTSRDRGDLRLRKTVGNRSTNATNPQVMPDDSALRVERHSRLSHMALLRWPRGRGGRTFSRLQRLPTKLTRIVI